MSVPIDVVFEKQVDNHWQPVRSAELRPGDIARMRMLSGEVLRDDAGRETFQVAGVNGRDPDSKSQFDVSLEPMV